MPTVLFENHQHSYIGLAWIVSINGADDACDGCGTQVSHHCQIGPCLEEVVVGEDGVGLSQLGTQDLCDPFELALGRECLERDLLRKDGLHSQYYNQLHISAYHHMS